VRWRARLNDGILNDVLGEWTLGIEDVKIVLIFRREFVVRRVPRSRGKVLTRCVDVQHG